MPASRPYAVVLSPLAEAKYEAAEAWWRLNRSAAPDLLSEELEQALLAIAQQPRLGRAGRSALFGAVRVYLLRHTEYKLYYQVVDEAKQIHVVYFRHGRRRPLRATVGRRRDR